MGYKDRIYQEAQQIDPYLTKTVSTDEEMIAAFLKKIESLANQSKVTLIKINPAAGEQTQQFWKYQADLECSGQLADVVSFMHLVDTATDLMKVVKFNFASKKSDTDEIKATMTIEKIVIPFKGMPVKAVGANNDHPNPLQANPPAFFLSVLCVSAAPLTASVLIFSFCVPWAHAQVQNFKDVYERAVNAYNIEQYDQAMDLYQQLIKAAPGFAPAYNGLALTIQASSGDEDKTIEYLKMAVGYDPKMTEAYVNLGRIYFGRQDFDPAEEYFEKALKLDPNLTSAQLSLAWINLLVRSKPLKALKYFKQVL